MKVLVIGHPDAVLGYSLAGVHGITATDAEQVNQALDEAFATRDVGIVLVTTDVASLIPKRMDQLKLHSTVPLVLEIPSPRETSANEPSIGDIVFRAIGVRL